jgi:hypothetical protein
VRDLHELAENPQVVHNRSVVTHEVGRLGRIVEARPAARMSETPLRVGGPAPMRGEHTARVLRRHGYSEAELGRLEEAGVFGGLGLSEFSTAASGADCKDWPAAATGATPPATPKL